MWSRVQHLAGRVGIPIALASFVLGLGPVLAQADAQHDELDRTSVFATFPFPGHPFGIAVDDDKIYVDTSRGDFFASQTNSAGERLFVLNEHGDILQTVAIPTMPNTTMGLWGPRARR